MLTPVFHPLWPLVIVVGALIPAAGLADDREQDFESKIRPLLHLRCIECHGPNKQQGDVRLDLRHVVLGRNEGEGLVIPGRPDDSRLIQVIRYSGDDVQMPPKGKLPAEEIELLTEWVRRGAYWPETDPAAASAPLPRKADGQIDFAAAQATHWAFQPITRPPLPPATTPGDDQHPIDRFIDARLSQAGVSAVLPADRATLIRRAMFDLWGIPPTYEEVQEFVRDERPDAWSRLIDHLLASPLYGQRWGRHWLDVARYADTKGYVFTENPRYPFAYTYRDYVVAAFNADKPFDQFVVEQLAADRLGLPERDPALAALGFLTAGPRYLNREPDIIDDRIDLITRGLMGLTVACARCHDHKYDPVPTADYYSLYGVLASSVEPESLPLLGEVPDGPGYRAFQAELEKRQQAVREFLETTRQELLSQLRQRSSDYLQAVVQRLKRSPPEGEPTFRHGAPRDRLVEVWQRLLEKRGQRQDPVFGPWAALAAIPVEQFSAQAPEVLRQLSSAAENQGRVNRRVVAALQAAPLHSLLDVARTYGSLLESVEAEWRSAVDAGGDSPPNGLPDAETEELRSVLYGPGSVTDLPDSDVTRLFERDHRDKLRQLERKVEEWHVESPDAPPRAMVLLDREQPVEPVVFLRGDPNRRGERVPRQPPRILVRGDSRPFSAGSGRLELARTIASPDNPLTARVIVNRVWAWHFGRGLVETLSDFGFRGERPTHPELLDWLAWTFMHEDGWSLKSLHRRIMLSSVYQRSTRPQPEAEAKDPENRLYWRMNRRRLEFEAMHDALLAVAGRLDVSLGGRPVDIETPPFSNRRALYARIDRNNFSSLLRTFDYPSPDASSPGRPVTTVPQQALYALNSPFLREIAESVVPQTGADQVRDEEGHPHRSRQVTLLYRQILARDPAEDELRLGADFLAAHNDDLPVLAQALLLTNEFLFVD